MKKRTIESENTTIVNNFIRSTKIQNKSWSTILFSDREKINIDAVNRTITLCYKAFWDKRISKKEKNNIWLIQHGGVFFGFNQKMSV